MTTHRVTLIPGDGIGPELVEATRRVLEATGVSFDWDVQQVGEPALELYGTPLPDSVAESVRANGVALKGPISTPKVTGFRSVNVALRVASGMYANVRPCRTFPGVHSRFEDVDVVVIRDVTEDLYAGVEAMAGTPEAEAIIAKVREVLPKARIADGAAITIRAISEEASLRLAEYAFQYAERNNRRKVTAVHKANVMKATDGVFLSACREVAERHPAVEFEETAVDALAMHMVQHPERFDVMVMPMQYGDIISDLAAGFIGGPGMMPGGNYGTHAVLFEPGHGSAPYMAGQNRANPMATMLSGVMMLRHLDEWSAADRLEAAIAEVVRQGRHTTYDLREDREDPTAGTTSGVADAVIAQLSAAVPAG